MALRDDALRIWQQALQAVEPGAAVKRYCSRQRNLLRVDGCEYELRDYARVRVFGAGKACDSMAHAMEDILGRFLVDGIGITNRWYPPPPRAIALFEASHPLPDARGLRATGKMLKHLEGGSADDLVIFLLSGGASALLESLPEGVTLAHMRQLTSLLLRSGASIEQVNTVRKCVSQVKGGRLLLAAAPAQCLVLVLSDVLGNPLDAIGSGPMYPALWRPSEALRILQQFDLMKKVPAPVWMELDQTVDEEDELREQLEQRASRVRHVVVGDNALMASAANAAALELGYHSVVHSTSIQGEASAIGGTWASLVGGAHERPACIVGSGETTVTVRGRGRGGRNQEMALGFALAAQGLADVLMMCAASDGLDGPTNAAGAFADGDTVNRARELGLDAVRTLQRNDCYPFFDSLGDLVMCGPTGTNVNDLYLLLVK